MVGSTQPAGCSRSAQRDAHGLEEITAGRERFALGAIQLRQLGVVTEAAARAIDSLELAHEFRRSLRQRGIVGRPEQRGRAERGEVDPRRRH